METWHNLKIAEMPMRLYDLLQKECMTTPYKELDSKFNNISNILFYEKNSLEDKDIQNFLNYLIRDFNHLYGSELIIEKDSDKRIILKQFKDEEFIQIDLCKYIIDNYSYIPKSNLTLAETYWFRSLLNDSKEAEGIRNFSKGFPMYYEKAWHSEPNDLKNSETARNLANRQIVDINKVLSSLGSNLLLDEYANIKEESCSIKRKRV